MVWHFNPEVAAKHALYGCGNVWSSPALGLDPSNPNPARRAVLYFGTADCPDNGTTACPSDRSDPYCPPGQHYDYADRWERFSESIDAISAVTGAPLWSYQGHVPLNSDDDDYGASAQLFALRNGRPVVGEGGKDGLYYVLDRATGKLIWKQVEVGNGNVERGFALGGFLGSTAVLDVAGAPVVFGGSAIDSPVTYEPATGKPTLQPSPTMEDGLRPMTAFSGTNGQTAWTAPQLYTYGATSAANGVVYSGSLDGVLHAYDAATGRLLWAFPVGVPISSGAAITAGTVVIGAGTSETDLEFKACDRVPASLAAQCKATPLSVTLNPLSDLNGIWAFSVG